jgi:D-alanine-D-alanine ligase
MLEDRTTFKKQLLVWVFIPYRMTKEGLVGGQFYSHPSTHQDLESAFNELGISWKWQPITLENAHAVVKEVATSRNHNIPVVLNYCNGFDEIDGLPGLSIIKLLEEEEIPFTGADSSFEYQCISKIRMKKTLLEAGVSTAPYEVIADLQSIQGICSRLNTPLIVKPSVSYASYGISSNSVVDNDEQVTIQVQHLLQGYQSLQVPSDGIFVEQFINGSEFTVFVLGSYQNPKHIKVYPPVERAFQADICDSKRLVSEEYWTKKPNYSYRLVDSPLFDRLCQLGQQAYCAVHGNGYGRVDIRMNRVSGELFVLEVNPNCAISSQPLSKLSKDNECATSLGGILSLANISFTQLISEILTEAHERYDASLLVSNS